jgi:BlaI family penicillinase repressor
VKDALNDGSAYTTILSLLRVLEEKGGVTRRLLGRAHIYTANVPRDATTAKAVTRLANQFFGSREALLTHLVAHERMSPDLLRTLRTILDQRLEEDDT